MDGFAATRLAIGAGTLAIAAASDFRTRRVRDPLWIGLGTIGLVLVALELDLDGSPWPAWSLLACVAILFYAIFFGQPLFDEEGFHARPVRLVVFVAASVLFVLPLGGSDVGNASTAELVSVPVMVVVYQGLYRLRLLHGGADAKALIALTVLLPMYPDASPFPLLSTDPRIVSLLRVVFPFSLVVWVDAAIVFLAVPIGLVLFNALHRDLAWPQALLGYRVPLERFPKHAWLMERMTARGEHVLVLFPKRGTDPAAEIQRLRATGIDRGWVTPQIPFMIPLLVGFLLAFFVGNILLGIFSLAR